MEASESICDLNPIKEVSELEFQPSKFPNSDLDQAPSDDPNRTEEDHTPPIYVELQSLSLKEESEPVLKEEAEKDGNWDLKEVEQEQWVEKDKGVLSWEEGKGGESGWDDWKMHVNVNGNGNENEIEKVVEVVSILSVPEVEVEVEVEESGERNDNGNANSKRHQYQYPVRPEAEDCAFYLKTGTCKFASNCKFNHPVRRKNQVFVCMIMRVRVFFVR